MKYLIFDTGPIISLSMNGLLYILEDLKKKCNCEFLITPPVKRELIDKPKQIKKFELEAFKVKNLIETGILTLSSKIIDDSRLTKETKKFLDLANTSLTANGQNVALIQEGEASCLALAKLCNCESLLVIDERTTRLLIESPESLKRMMEKRLHAQIKIKEKLGEIKSFKIIRATELLFYAYNQDLLRLKKEKPLLDSVLYASKFHGTAISTEEIEDMKKLV